jgi:hypothetical protein
MTRKGVDDRTCQGDCERFWPHEQAVLDMFVVPGFREHIRLLPWPAMNGFGGELVRHIYSLRSIHRQAIFGDVLIASATAAGVAAGRMQNRIAGPV